MSLKYGMSFYSRQEEAISRNDLICPTGGKSILLIRSDRLIISWYGAQCTTGAAERGTAEQFQHRAVSTLTSTDNTSHLFGSNVI